MDRAIVVRVATIAFSRRRRMWTSTVRVEGAGRLIGLDTGDLNYGGLFKTDTRDAYEGRLLATVQRTAPTGEVRVLAAAAGLSVEKK